ncbi:MAG: hypothetical protein ACI89X_004506, partial [Planctomycetota bacterium]
DDAPAWNKQGKAIVERVQKARKNR